MTKAKAARLLRYKLVHRHPRPFQPLELRRSKHNSALPTTDRAFIPPTWTQHQGYSTFTKYHQQESHPTAQPNLQQPNSGSRSLRNPPTTLYDSQNSDSIHGTSPEFVGSTDPTYKEQPRASRPLESNLGTWTTLFVVSIVSGIYFYSSSAERIGRPEQHASEVEILREPENFDMPQENQAGRVGYLTPEEDEKLKELWILTLEVFGVLEKGVNGNGVAETGKVASDLDGKKHKKKRLGMFRRHKDSDADPSTSTESGTHAHKAAADDNDKYGQTKEFNEAIASQSPESLRATFWSMVKHDHPDALLLRFLRARKWDVNKALVMMISTMKWRATDVHVDDDIMKHGELACLIDASGDNAAKKKLGDDFLAQLRMGKSFFHGIDKEGRPMCFVRVRLHKAGEQIEESLERYTVSTIEIGRMILAPPTDTACVVFDMTGFSMANMDYAPVKFMIKCFEANYPESLGVVLVHKAPWVFQGIWKIIRGWLDPVVASKVNFTNNNEEMEKFVPRANIIKELGGEENWEYKYIEPTPGENDKMKDIATRDKLLLEREETVNQYESATKDWIDATGDSTVAKETRHKLANQLRDGYWVLDPYIRARSYYDRVGLIGPGGKPQFYPSREPSKTEAPAPAPAPILNGPPRVETSTDDLD